MNRLSALLLSLACAACTGNGNSTPPHLSGTFRSDDGRSALVFSEDQKVSAVFFGRQQTTTYFVQDNAVRLQFRGGDPLTLTINPDGSLTSLTSTHYSKQ